MNAIPTQNPLKRTHPLYLVAAASVTALSLAGVGVLAGWLPGPGGRAAPPTATAVAPAPVSIAQNVTLPATPATPAAAKPAAHASERPSVRGAERATERRASSGTTAADTHVAGDARPADARDIAVASREPIATASAADRAICASCGVVESVTPVAVEGKGSGGGAVAGGIIGGILGNQVSKGATRDFATVLGALGGAYAGNHIEKSVKEGRRYDTVVRFEDGSSRVFSSETPPQWHSGDRVRLQNGALVGRSDIAGSV